MMRWESHGWLRVVLVFSQQYVDLVNGMWF